MSEGRPNIKLAKIQQRVLMVYLAPEKKVPNPLKVVDMQLYFIRHGQSTNNRLFAQTGSSSGRDCDPELTDLGKRQAIAVAHLLAAGDPGGYDGRNGSFGITHLYTSPMMRAVNTALTIADALGLSLHLWEDIHEAGGIYLDDEQTGAKVGQPGKDRAYFETHYPTVILPDGWGNGGWWDRPFEEDEQRIQRARRFLADLLERHAGGEDRVAVVSHGEFYFRFLSALLDLPAKTNYWFTLHNAAIARINFTPQEVQLVYLNRYDHLVGELLS
jgi:2,3-bisphosphoglycerate-dependent phosphoglycerate mutase